MNLESLRHFYLRNVTAPFLRILGPTITTNLARRLARGMFEMHGPARRYAEIRIRDAFPANAPSTNRQIATETYDNLARFWIEALFNRRVCRQSTWRNRVTILDEHLIQQIKEQERGCIIASALLGNPIMCAFSLSQLLGKIHVLMDLDASPELGNWLGKMHRVPGVELIPRREAAQRLPAILEEGGAIWMIAENDRSHGFSVRTSFLGRTLRAFPTMARLAKYYDVPILAAVCTRHTDNPRSFQFDLHLRVIETDATSSDDIEVTKQILGALETLILTYPEQYLWTVPMSYPVSAPKQVSSSDDSTVLVAAN